MKTFACYLPQFYPTPENDAHWGKGFTEWHNVKSAKPLFPGHIQPKIPRDFGYYDLREKEVLRQQSSYARQIGIDGFSFWHYWFGGGKMSLEKPSQSLLSMEDIDIGYYFTWVNADWTKSWVGQNSEIIFEQQYDDVEDYKRHFEYVLPFFRDPRYLRIDNKPVFAINGPRRFDAATFMEVFEKLSISSGLAGITWLAPLIHVGRDQRALFDFVTGYPPGDISLTFSYFQRLRERIGLGDVIKKIDYQKYARVYVKHVGKVMSKNRNYIPTFMPNWDNTPRYKENGFVFVQINLESIKSLYAELRRVAKLYQAPMVLIKSWNEWAEGNYVEPDEEFGTGIGTAIREVSFSGFQKND